ncbi:porin [Paraburkholderia antibiotica]|uniref:Porin n=1 Tax=Paraburkholderia antibiotica TaxID=2728839 RepID=A0A7Y0A111_9BURK|nr:porin [Paraburkholderia antibiotica]NML34498.1 porin [Paraburkholderia antibiotica]
MQRTKWALLLAAVMPMSAYAQSSSVTLYGLLDAGISYVNNVGGHSAVYANSGIWQAGRFGFLGREDLGGGYAAIFRLESGVSPTTGTAGNSSSFFSRQSYLGVESPYGRLTLGRQYDFLYVTSLPLGAELFAGPVIAGVAGGPGGTAGNIGPIDSHFGGTNYNNTAKWTKDWGPVTVGYMHGFSDGSTDNGTSTRMDSALLSYHQGPINVGVGWTQDHLSAAQSGNTANRVLGIKANYKLGDFTLLGSYANASSRWSPARNQPLEFGVDYQVNVATHAGIAVEQAVVTNAAGVGTTLRQVTAGANYALSKRTLVYAIGAINRSSNVNVYHGFVGLPGGATAPSSGDAQSVLRVGMITFF